MTYLQALNSRMLIFYIIALSNVVLPLSFDVFFIAQENIAESLRIDVIETGKIQALWSLGLCLGQLICGPLVDSYGRKFIFLLGMILLLVSSIISFYMANISFLIGVSPFSFLLLMRFLQGLGLSTQLICSKAIINDIFPNSHEKSIYFSTFISWLLAFAVAAPLITGIILSYSSWEVLFLMLSFVTLLLVLGLTFIPETLAPSQRYTNISYWHYLYMFKNTKYVGYMLINTLAFVWIFTGLFVLPMIVIKLFELTPQVYSIFSATTIVVSIMGSLVNRYFLQEYNYDINDLILKGCLYILGIGCILFISAILGILNWEIPILSDILGRFANLSLILIIYLAGNFFISLLTINCMTGAINSSKEYCGTGSAILGIVQFGIGSITFPLVGIITNYLDILLTMSLMQVTTILLCILIYYRMIDTQASKLTK